VSTVPGSYRPFGAGANDPVRIAANLGRWAAAAARAARDGKRRVVLALEPEPWCFLETSFDVAAFWRGALAEHGVAACAAALDGDPAAARDAVADHLGICFDTCHFSLAFEDQAAAVARMTDAGAGIAKIQLSAAPEVVRPLEDPTGVAELKALAEPRFLHQTAASSHAGSLVKVEDLDQLDACLARLPGAHAVRSHFHIPLFRAPRADGLSSTIDDSIAGLRACLAQNPDAHLSVETYTWSVLAPDQRDALAGTVRELEFLHGAVAGLGIAAR
ncbi:MAG: sugar phosphate isomerase, partial [Planctomycetes bacterium]|nr:sugar phosphate isomerase [Planctomycetota bacterium]